MRGDDLRICKIGVEIHASGLEKLAGEADKRGKPDIGKKVRGERDTMLEILPLALESSKGPEGKLQREQTARAIEAVVKELRWISGRMIALGEAEDGERYGARANDLEMRLLPQYDDRPQLTLTVESGAEAPAEGEGKKKPAGKAG